MEPDLPLIQISGDDDTWNHSLDDTSVSASPLFSPIARLKDNSDGAAYNTSGADNGNKENINANKSELTKLSVEPQQMKRRKKGGAYNLRKSLAWDKAFSTDEGFLDPSELSMLGGSNVNSCREFLPSLREDGGKFSGNSYSKGDSSDLQGTPRTMSNLKCSSSGSKSRCPRPLDFSSHKRPAITYISKAAAKESKLPKLPVSKLDSRSLLKSSKNNLPSTSPSCQTKYNQDCREDIQKAVRSQNTIKITKTSTSKRKSNSDSVSAADKSLIQQSRRSKDISARKLFSTSDVQPRQSSLATRANSGHKVPSEALPPSGSNIVDSHELLRRNRALSEKVSAVMPMPQVQLRKPSGLRMPSPSLGFFSQHKSSTSNSFTQKVTQPINITGSYVPNSSRLPHVPVTFAKKVLNNSSDVSSEVSGSSLECLSSSDYANTHERVNAELAKQSILVKESKVLLHAKSVEVTKENQAEQRTSECNMEIQEIENSCGVGQSSFMQHMDLEKYENHLLKVNEFSDELEKDGTNVIVDSSEVRGCDNVHLEKTNFASQISCQAFDLDDHDSRPESHSEGSAGDFEKDSVLMMFNDDSKATLHIDQQKIGKANSVNAFFGEDDIMMTLPMRSDDFFLEDKSFRHLKYEREDFANGISKLCKSKKSEILPHVSAEQANQDNFGLDQVHDENSVADDTDSLLHFKILDVEKCGRIHGLETTHSVSLKANHSDIVTETRGLSQNDDVVLSDSFEFQPETVGATDMEKEQIDMAKTGEYSKMVSVDNDKKVEDSKIIDQYYSREFLRTTIYSSKDPVLSRSCEISCLLPSTMEVQKSAKDNTTNVLYKGDTEGQTLNRKNSRLINSVPDNLVSAVSADTNAESGQPPEMHLSSLAGDQYFKVNHVYPLNDCTFVSEITSREGREGNYLSTAVIVQERTDRDQVQLSMDGGDVLVESLDDKQSSEGETSSSIATETSIEHDISSLDTVFRSDVVTYKDSISSYRKSHSRSSEKIGPVDQNTRASAESIELNQKNESLITAYQQARDNTSRLREDSNASLSIKGSGDGGTIDNLAIKPPVHAVPFSDEWLATMEAAGEEILTMKRGAVQNSPTDKALPEPSPWSPVKRKQNQIGPYDCTKFLNLPQSSD